MNYAESLLDIKRRPVDEVVGKLLDSSESVSKEAGLQLVKEAMKYGINVRDYLILAVKGEDGLNGYETALMRLNLPVRNDFENGIVLQAASNTFQTYPGTRAMFPEVIDDMLRWQDRMPIFESPDKIVANSRTIAGTELVSTVVNDDSAERDTFSVPELGRIPVRTIRTSETSVRIWKHGSGLRTSYEFNRRASLDILTPFANRVARELEKDKTTAAVNVIINGDGVNSPAPVVAQKDLAEDAGATHKPGEIVWEIFLYWLVLRARAGTPVDTIIGNWDSWFKWQKLMATPSQNMGPTIVQLLAAAGVNVNTSDPNPLRDIRFALASAAPAGKLIGITKGETIEELIEAGSNIQESARSIENQSMVLVKTENTGYKLAWPDTRSVYDYTAKDD